VFSFIKRKDPSPAAPAAEEPDSVQAARTRARRRLIGAAVLVGLGIVGFPMLFETQPRPIAVDIPIEIPSRETAPPLGLPASKPMAGAAAKPDAASAPAPAVAASAAPAEAAAASASTHAERAPPPEAEVERAAPPPQRPAPTPEQLREAQRAQALLEGKPVPPPDAPVAPEAKAARFVVQAGAYTDASSLRDARQKVEKLGLKTYTQVIETDSGARTRVRVGPFPTREEAEKAASRIKGAGLAVSILSL
jgi:DedD protein